LRKLTGDEKLKTKGEIQSAEMSWGQIASMTLTKPILINFKEPIGMSSCRVVLMHVRPSC
jgi:hypothetical protein